MIGSAIVEKAMAEGWEVLCLVRKGSKRMGNIPVSNHVHVVEADLSDYASLQISDVWDVFIHLGWDKTYGNSRDDVDVQLMNIRYTMDAVRLAKRYGCSVFVGAGSQAEYGPVQARIGTDTPTCPESGYGIAKLCAGQMARLLCGQLGMRFNWLRILSVYGIHDAPQTLIMYTIRELLAGRSPELTECGQIWDYCNSKDVASAFLSVAENGVDGKNYPLGSGKGMPLKEYLSIIQKAINPSTPLGFGAKPYYPHQPMYLVADITSLSNDTGWKPAKPFEIGIKEVISSVSNTSFC